jgi:tripartite-type tricarboxylate transporter receptor subunit TctC
MTRACYALAAALPVALAAGAAAADWPERPVTAIAGWAAGGASDIVTRALAREMEEPLGQRITVTNITGALGSIGAQSAMDAGPDGYTWFGGAAVAGTWPVLDQAELSWEDMYAFLAVVFPTTIYVRADAPWETIEDLIADIEASGEGEMSYGHPGAGSNGEIFASLVMSAAGVAGRADAIPYSGGREAGQFLITGELDFASVTMGDVTDWAVEGSIRPLANLYHEDVEFEGVTFPSVVAHYPELEPFAAINPYFGIYLHRETPEDIVVRTAEAFAYAVQQDRFIEIAVNERAGVLDPFFGQAADEVMSRVESARGWPLYEGEVAPNNPGDRGIPRVDAWSWPPHERAANARPWPEAAEEIYKDLRAALD